FDNVNIDLISGMVGETWENWKDCIRRTIDMNPESVTIYQMELPFNTVYSKDLLGTEVQTPVADWPTKRAWVGYAFDELSAVGYSVSSAYTMVRNNSKVSFSYRDNLWKGSDLLATGIASFGHVSGVHYQNKSEWEGYINTISQDGQLPLNRALRPSAHQLLIREMILQLKRGYLDNEYFQEKFQVNILEHWKDQWEEYRSNELLTVNGDRIELTREGLLQVDGMLPVFFEKEHQGVRYT
ncbi:MAG: coproporphyrinogen III oxidase, partial [Pirellulaceae bacterium]